MSKVNIEEVTKALDKQLEAAHQVRETNIFARVALEVDRPGHIWRARERNRGTAPEDMMAALCEHTAKLVSAELIDIECDIDAKIRLFNHFTKALTVAVADQLERHGPGVGHA